MRSIKTLILLILLIHLILLFATRFTLWPEMVVYPYLINHGFLLYTEIVNPYPPLLPVFLSALTAIIGYNPMTMRSLTYVLILLIDFLIYYISAKLTKNPKIALINTLFFVVFSIPLGVNGLWFDLTQTPFILGSVYFLINTKKPSNFLISLLLISIAFFIKQQVLWLLPIFAYYTYINYKLYKTVFLKILSLCFVLLTALTGFSILLVYVFGSLPEFITLAIVLPFFESRNLPGYILLPNTQQVLLVACLFGAFLPGIIRKKEYLSIYTFSALLVLFAYPRFDYFHLIPSLAVLSLLVSSNFKGLTLRGLPQGQSLFLYLFFVPVIVFSLKQYRIDFGFQTRFFEPAVIEAGEKLKRSTNSEDLLYFQNGPDQLMVLADRLPSKPWADEFPWYLEYNGLQAAVVSGIKKEKPKFIVIKPYVTAGKFALGAYKPQQIVNYLENNYQVGRALGANLFLAGQK